MSTIWSRGTSAPSVPVFHQAEVNLGSHPRRDGYTYIYGSGFTPGAPVMIHKANGPYPGKGTRADESEMDQLVFSGRVLSPTVLEVDWHAKSVVMGKFLVNYSLATLVV